MSDKKKLVSIYLDSENYKALKMYAAKNTLFISDVIGGIIDEFLKKIGGAK